MAPTGVDAEVRGLGVRGYGDVRSSDRQATVSDAGAIRCASDPAIRRHLEKRRCPTRLSDDGPSCSTICSQSSRLRRYLSRAVARPLRPFPARDIRQMQTMAKTLRRHRRGLLHWYDHPISTDPLEGINNKFGALQRRAYGNRNYEHLKERLLTLHHTKYTLQG